MDSDFTRQLKINHLRLVSAIAEHGQLNLAAETLAITQPSASRMLAEIEGILGAKICQRHARGMTLTLIGEVLARRAHDMLVEMRGLSREIDDLKLGKEGIARVGAVTGAALGYVVPAVQQVKALSPTADILVNVSPSDELIRELVAGHYDFVLARMPVSANIDEFMVRSGRSETVALVVNQNHPLSSAKRLSLHQLGAYAWVMQESGTPIHEAVRSAFFEANAALPRNITNTTSLLVMIALLASSTAIAPMSTEVLQLLAGQAISAHLTCLELQHPIIVSPYHLIMVRGRRLSPLARRLYSLVQEELSRHSA